MLSLTWILQVLILSVGIHLFLRFVRHTRGSRLIRGLYVAVLLGWVGLWGLSKPLHLEELEHILQSATGFLVVIFAIVFQPELRRGIAQLGERSFRGGWSRANQDTLRRIVRAARSMAARRHGALIAFEKESSLNTYVETGAQLDAEVSARLIETIFNPKGPLHDGAIVIRGGRIAAAGCFFPLPQEGEFDPSMGTRHRAALGLTEENDAIVLVVSEETGSISIAQEGSIRSKVPDDKLEEELDQLLSASAATTRAEDRRLFPPTGGTWRGDLAWMLASVLLASGILYLAHQQILTADRLPLRFHAVAPAEVRAPRPGELLVLLPSENHRVLAPEDGAALDVEVTGSRVQLESIRRSLSGRFEVPGPEWSGGPLKATDVEWSPTALGVAFEWQDRAPELRIERFESRSLEVAPEDVEVDDSRLDPHYELQREALRIEPGTVTVRAPRSALESLVPAGRLSWKPIVLGPEDQAPLRAPLELADELVERGFSIAPGGGAEVIVSIVPAYRQITGVTKEIALTCLEPERMDELSLWEIPAHLQTARFSIQTSGLVPVGADPSSPALIERFAAIRNFVEENLHVYVDVSELDPEGETSSARVYHSLQKDWRAEPEALGLDPDEIGEAADLRVELESDELILLERRAQDEGA